MRSGAFVPASLAAAALAMAFAPRAGAEILVNIDKNTQSMTVTVDRTRFYVWPVSTGRPGFDTPNGTFRPNRMDADHLSQEWDNAPMPFTIFFDLHGHAIHGFLNTSQIGNPASHGCVRLSKENAATLFDLVKMEHMKDTTVVITGRTPSPESLVMARHRGLVEANAALPAPSAPHNSEQPPDAHGKEPAPHRQQAAAYQEEPAVYEKLRPPASVRLSPAAFTQEPLARGRQLGANRQQPVADAQRQQPVDHPQQQQPAHAPQPAAYRQQHVANAQQQPRHRRQLGANRHQPMANTQQRRPAHGLQRGPYRQQSVANAQQQPPATSRPQQQPAASALNGQPDDRPAKPYSGQLLYVLQRPDGRLYYSAQPAYERQQYLLPPRSPY
jgi:hypothetical protein